MQFNPLAEVHSAAFDITVDQVSIDVVDNPRDDNKHQSSEILMSRCDRLTVQVLILESAATLRTDAESSVRFCNQIVTISEQTTGVILRQVWYIRTVRIVINSQFN